MIEQVDQDGAYVRFSGVFQSPQDTSELVGSASASQCPALLC